MLMLDGEYNDWVDWKTTLNHVNDVGEVVADMRENYVQPLLEEEEMQSSSEEENSEQSESEEEGKEEEKSSSQKEHSEHAESEAEARTRKVKVRKRLGDLIEEQALWITNRDRVCCLFFGVFNYRCLDTVRNTEDYSLEMGRHSWNC
jgi:hypothetical protein